MSKNSNILFSPQTQSNGSAMGIYAQTLYDHIQSILSSPKNSTFTNLTVSTHPGTTPDLIHQPFFNPFTFSLPRRPNPQTKIIVTIPDLIPLELPHLFSPGLKATIIWQLQKFLLSRRLDYIITISHASKHVIHRLTRFPLDRIFVTHISTQPGIKSHKAKPPSISKYHLPSKYVLYVGDAYPSKNLPRLANACLSLQVPLVMVGHVFTTNPPLHQQTMDLHYLLDLHRKHPDQIIFPGKVPDSDITSIFTRATLYCQPSYSEGFGMPIVEAMKLGTPLLIADTPCNAEVSQRHAHFFNPTSDMELQNQLRRLLADSKYRQLHLRQAKAAAASYSWTNAALGTLAVYQLALNEIT